MYDHENVQAGEKIFLPAEQTRNDKQPSAADVLQNTVACMQRALFITGKLMNGLTGVLPNEVPIKNPDNMAEHVRLVNDLGNELLQRLEDLTRSIVG